MQILLTTRSLGILTLHIRMRRRELTVDWDIAGATVQELGTSFVTSLKGDFPFLLQRSDNGFVQDVAVLVTVLDTSLTALHRGGLSGFRGDAGVLLRFLVLQHLVGCRDACGRVGDRIRLCWDDVDIGQDRGVVLRKLRPRVSAEYVLCACT